MYNELTREEYNKSIHKIGIEVELQNKFNDRFEHLTPEQRDDLHNNYTYDLHKNYYHVLNMIFQELSNLAKMQKPEFEHCKSSEFVTKLDLLKVKDKIMSKVSEFAVKQNAFNVKMDEAITGIQGDVKSLNELIVTLQNTQGEISTEDQTLLDEIEVRATEIVAKLEALDALTPAVPVTGSV